MSVIICGVLSVFAASESSLDEMTVQHRPQARAGHARAAVGIGTLARNPVITFMNFAMCELLFFMKGIMSR